MYNNVNMDIMCACVYSHPGTAGPGSSMRLKAQGMEFSVWVCKFAAQHQLKAMAPAVLQVSLSCCYCTGTVLQRCEGRGRSEQRRGCAGVLCSTS